MHNKKNNKESKHILKHTNIQTFQNVKTEKSELANKLENTSQFKPLKENFNQNIHKHTNTPIR